MKLFPQHTINSKDSGLDDSSYDKNSFQDQGLLLQKKISDIILHIKKEETNDEESTIVLAFYCHLILIKILNKNFDLNYGKLLSPYYDYFLAQPHNIRHIHELAKSNIDSFYEITNDIFLHDDKKEESIEWVDILMNVFNNYINLYLKFSIYRTDSKCYDISVIQQNIMNIINQQLEIGYFSKTFLYHITSLVITMWFNGKAVEHFPTLSLLKREIIKKYNQKVKEVSSFCEKIDNIPIPKGENELRLFVIARNESLRLPYFLEYYKKLGIDRFFIIDNNSTDNSREIALSYENVHVFKIERSYKDHWYWMEYFLNKYGKNRWCIVVDVDELLYFPYLEYLKLPKLIEYLQLYNYTALRSVLLDFHSDKAIADTVYKSNSNPIDYCPFFDPSYTKNDIVFFDKKRWSYFNRETYIGGVRTKFFKKHDAKHWFYITKFSLIKYMKNTYLTQGMHGINGAKIADIEGVVVHTKFMYDFIYRIDEESKREEHFNNAMEYKIYNESINNKRSLTLKNENSVEFGGTDQFLQTGVMKCSQKYMNMFNLNI